MVWKRDAALKERLGRKKPFLEALASCSAKKRTALLNKATESELRVLRDLIQKVFLKKRLPIPEKIFCRNRRELNFLVKKLKGQKVNKPKELRKIAVCTHQVLAPLVKLLLS